MAWLGYAPMRKWLLIFLVLANALLFMGYHLVKKESVVRQNAQDDALELKLVSEISKESLIKRESAQLDVDEAMNSSLTNNDECYIYSGIESTKTADTITAFFAEQGIIALIFLNDKAQLEIKAGNAPAESSIFLQVKGDIDRNLINKINKVLVNSYKTLIIEKKVCKGVAS